MAFASTALINFASSKVKMKPLDEWISGYIIVHIFVLSEIYRVIILAQYSVAINSVDMSAACPGYGEIHGSGGRPNVQTNTVFLWVLLRDPCYEISE